MSRRGDNIHKRKDGRWEGRYKNGVRTDGTTRYSSVYASSYTECKQKLILAQTQKNPHRKTSGSARLFSDILYAWIEANRIRIKGATLAKYMRLIDSHIMPGLGGIKIQQLNSGVIHAFLTSKLEAGGLKNKAALSPSYVRTMAVIIEAAIRYAATEGLCSSLKSPISKPTIPKHTIAILSGPTEQTLTEKLYVNLSPVSVGILLGLQGGLRIGEVCALRWSDIDFESGIIHVRHTVSRVPCSNSPQKTRLILDTPKTTSSIRDIPIPAPLHRALLQAYSDRLSEFVISTSPGFVGTRTFDYQYRRWLAQYGIPIFRFHSLRHTYATRCAESGMDAKMLSQLLGHSSPTISLNVYVHPSLEQAMQIVDCIFR